MPLSLIVQKVDGKPGQVNYPYVSLLLIHCCLQSLVLLTTLFQAQAEGGAQAHAGPR